MSCEKTYSAAIMVTEKLRRKISPQRFWFFLFSLLASAGIFTYLFSVVSIREVINLLKGITLDWIFLFLIMSFSMSLFRTWRYTVILNASGYRPNLVASYLITLVRNFFSDLLPARLGTLIYIYLVQNRLGVPFGAAAASFALSFVFDILALALLIILAALDASSDLIPPIFLVTGGLILALGSGFVLVLLPVIITFMAKVSGSLPLIPEKYRLKLHHALDETRKNIDLSRNQGIFWKILSLSFGVRIFKYLSLYVLLLALVLPLGFSIQSFPFSKVFLGLCSAELAASLPISGIAGFGVYEGAWALVFQLLGYSEHIAALTSISHHLLTQVYGYSLGALALLVLLLPFFQTHQNRKEDFTMPLPSRFFWVKLTGTFIVLLTLCFVLLPTDNNSQEGQSSNNAGVSIAQEIDNFPSSPDQLTGKVVYQRPDGIYTVKIGSKKTRRVVEYGTSPRWSPDGKHIAFVDKNKIMLVSSRGGKAKVIATAAKAKAICFDPDGRSVLFTDDKYLRRVDLKRHEVTTVLKGDEFREIDMAEDGIRLAATVRTSLGFRVRVFDLQTGKSRTVTRGCSASLSPDGSLVTVNGRKHRVLNLYQWDSLQQVGHITAPAGGKFDNQVWSNSPQWIVSTSEGDRPDIFIHHVPSDTSYSVTSTGDCDRGDLFVSIPKK
jgi:uncharacterized protein (TIRG00374 family)